ncbi:MAG: SDR family oxidoreductase [Bacteroidales bacterium]|nr:SDR family oxidoreductase [Bacteroidales bacterium]
MKKISVVSGGSGGLGLEIASQLLRAGKDVLILGRNREKLRKTARKLARINESGHLSTLVCNVGDENDVLATGQFLGDHRIVPEYLFNNAGRGLSEKAPAITSAMIDSVFEASLKGMILLTSMILRITPPEQELTIVNIMSTSALTGRENETVYCAAKWGARGYTEALRAELQGTKRNIIAVYPGGMKTGFYKTADPGREISKFMDPAEVAEKIVNAVLNTHKLVVTDITINRKKTGVV